jgi:hypothetical protein
MNKLFIFVILSLASCSKSDYNATFTGFDFKKCLCCGGYEITLESGEKVIGNDISESLGDPSDKKFPFRANIVFKKSDGCKNVILIENFTQVK